MAALAGVVAAAVVLAVAELIGAFFTARATPLFALGSTFIDFTPPWRKNVVIWPSGRYASAPSIISRLRSRSVTSNMRPV